MPPLKTRLGLLSFDRIQSRILILRGHSVLLDSDLANIYEVPTGRFNQVIGRKARRFPSNYRFQLTRKELVLNSSHPVIQIRPQITHLYRPWAFTQRGVMMAAIVLNSPCAIQMCLVLVSSFVEAKTRGDSQPLSTIVKAIQQVAVYQMPKLF